MHSKAKELAVKLKSTVSIKEMAKTTGDSDKSLYRLLSSPKKRMKEIYT